MEDPQKPTITKIVARTPRSETTAEHIDLSWYDKKEMDLQIVALQAGMRLTSGVLAQGHIILQNASRQGAELRVGCSVCRVTMVSSCVLTDNGGPQRASVYRSCVVSASVADRLSVDSGAGAVCGSTRGFSLSAAFGLGSS